MESEQWILLLTSLKINNIPLSIKCKTLLCNWNFPKIEFWEHSRALGCIFQTASLDELDLLGKILIFVLVEERNMSTFSCYFLSITFGWPEAMQFILPSLKTSSFFCFLLSKNVKVKLSFHKMLHSAEAILASLTIICFH